LSTLAPYNAAKINLYLKTGIYLFPTSVNFQNLKAKLNKQNKLPREEDTGK